MAGQIVSIRLKFDWWIGGSLDVSVNENGAANASYQFGIGVSLNGGSSWALSPVSSSNGIGVAGPGPVNDSAPIDGYGSVDINLTGTDISQIQVRDRLFVQTDSGISGSDGSATASFSATVSNIRLEVETVNCIASVPADRWKGDYFNNQTLTGSPAMVRDDGAGFLNLNFGGASPSSSCGLGTDNFSARWKRTVNFAAGTYRFTASVDNGVRLYVDGQLKIDQWGNLPPNTYTADVAFTAGNHEIKLELVEYTGGASASLSYADPWAGGANTITSPDGSVVTQWSYGKLAGSWQPGLIYKSERPDGTVVERIWQPNTPQTPYGLRDMNPYAKTEFVSIKNAAGALVKTAITDYKYDKNNNLTQRAEYDFVDYNTVPRDGVGRPTGIPSEALAALKRVTVNTYNCPTPDASDKTTPTPYTVVTPDPLPIEQAKKISAVFKPRPNPARVR